MGFLSNLARKIVNKDDDEALAVLGREQQKMRPPLRLAPQPADVASAPILPAPRRIDPTTMGLPPAPGTVVPMPNRIPPIDIGPPPARDPEGVLAGMERLATESAATMADADYSNATVGPDGNLTGLRFPTRAPMVPPPTRTVAPVEGVPEAITPTTPLPTKPPRVMVGETYKGMNPVQQSATRLRVLRSAAPESKVRDTGEAYEVEPPKQMSRLKAIGKGFLQTMLAGAPYGLGGMIGAGTVGAVQGGISPGRVARVGRAREIAEAENQQARALGLETEQLQNDSRRVANARSLAEYGMAQDQHALEMDRETRIEWQQGLQNIDQMQKAQAKLDPKTRDYAAATEAIQKEAARLSRRTGRTVSVIPGNPRLNELPRLQVDQQIVQMQPDGSWKAVFGSPKSDTTDENADLEAGYKWQVANSQNEAKRAAAVQEAAAFESAAADHQKKVTAAYNEIKNIEAQMKQVELKAVGPTPAYDILKQQLDTSQKIMADEQRKMDEAYKQAGTKKAEAAQYPTLPPPPKRARRSAAANTGGVQKLSKSAWIASHPGEDWNAAMQEANRRQIPIIP